MQIPLKPNQPILCSYLKNDPNKEYWFQAVMEQYSNNHLLGLWISPILRYPIPLEATILQVFRVFKVKTL